MNIIAIIPARMGSSRFPGKPLADIHGIPMVGHVTIRTAMCKELSSTWIATCDQVVMDYAASAGLKAVMTADTHVRCTTRTAEAMLKIEEMTGQRADIVVMVQGDEPMITPDMIDAAVEPMLKDPSINVVNLMADLATEEEFEDPNEVKVVTDLNGDALYFSREPIPSRRKGTPHVPMHKQVCIIPFRRDYLLKFNAMDECPLEIIESVDMMRILEHGEKVRMVPTDKRTLSVDTQEDLERVREMMRDDALRISYTKYREVEEEGTGGGEKGPFEKVSCSPPPPSPHPPKRFDWWGGRAAAFPLFIHTSPPFQNPPGDAAARPHSSSTHSRVKGALPPLRVQARRRHITMKHFLEELCIAALAWIPTAAGMGARLLLWRPLFKRCGRARFGTGIAMQGCKNMSLADGVRIGRGCQLYAEGGTLDMGEDAALSPGVTVDASGGLIRIGKQVAIGPGTVLRAANHCFDSLEKPIMLQGHLYGEIVIEDDVWIAANCTITPGTRIGHGAVVGAGAVVTRDVEPYAIVGGVPARVIGSRRKD